MKLCVLASGSKGNCTYIETAKSKVLVDCGISAKMTTQKLNEIGVDAKEIDAIFVTHEHSDHIKGISVFSRTFDVPVFAHNKIWHLLNYKIGDLPSKNMLDFFDEDFFFQDLTLSPFAVPHDSLYCIGYSFYNQGEKVSVTTDLGEISPQTLERLDGSKTIVLESNHDIEMLKRNPNYSQDLKDRILSKNGHLSNLDCSTAILKLANNGTKTFVLAHLSEENNTRDCAFSQSANLLKNNGINVGQDVEIDVASQIITGKIHN